MGEVGLVIVMVSSIDRNSLASRGVVSILEDFRGSEQSLRMKNTISAL